MRRRPLRLITILANACAILLLGLAGVAVAGPTLVFGQLDLYGPFYFSGMYTIDLLSSSWQISEHDFVTSNLYVVPDLSNTLSLLNDFAHQLSGEGISRVVVLPASDTLFASVPEPLGLSVVISGIAGLSFVRRRLRTLRRG